ncbi:MAG: hypothetical protein WKF82_09155 [Nocardioidaceae bacterium]
MRAENRPEFLVAALVEQVLIERPDRRQEAIGVIDDDGAARTFVLDLEAIVAHLRLRQHGDPDALVLMLHRDGG